MTAPTGNQTVRRPMTAPAGNQTTSSYDAPTGNQIVRRPMMALSATKLYIILWVALYACVSDGRVTQRVPGAVYNDII